MNNLLKIYKSKVNLDISDGCIQYLFQSVPNESKERFYRFHSLKNSLHTLYGEVIVRYIVTKQYSIKNECLEIKKSIHGKPYIPNVPVHFNISHSEDWVVCAISNQNVGIDIECIKDINTNIALHFFSREENDFLHNNEGTKKLDSFYDIWTLKESYIKWTGLGLKMPLQSFRFDISDRQIILVDNSKTNLPYFNRYPMEGYKLSVCSAGADFPECIEELNIEKICLG